MAQREPGGTSNLSRERWAALSRTAGCVRAQPVAHNDGVPAPVHRWRQHRRLGGGVVLAAAACALAALHLHGSTLHAVADTGADGTLFSLTNQDRASNGVRALNFSGTLQTIGEGGYYGGCGFAVHGRSVDMIQRNYFAHPIKGCGQLVFSIMRAYGVNYRSAGENIGWVSGGGSGGGAAGYINGQFMNSPDHRANILNPNYTHMGAGSDESAPGVVWTGGGGGYQNVWMFSEEFAQLGSAPPPPPRPTPRPVPHPASNPPRNSPAPPAPGQPPASTAPAPAGTAAPTPTAAPAEAVPTVPPGLLPAAAYPPAPFQSGGLLPDSIESVLEAFLIA